MTRSRPITPTHCPWPTTGDLDAFGACYVLRNIVQSWDIGPPESTFNMISPMRMSRAWGCSHLSQMTPFLAAIQAVIEDRGSENDLALVAVIQRYNLRIGTWDILANEFHNPATQVTLLREGKAINGYLSHNKLPLISTNAINPPEKPQPCQT